MSRCRALCLRSRHRQTTRCLLACSLPRPASAAAPGRGGDTPVLPLVAPWHLAVSKDVHPAAPAILGATHVLEILPAFGMHHHRIRKMAPGAFPFRIFTLQPAGACRVLVFHSLWFHRRPPASARRSAAREHHRAYANAPDGPPDRVGADRSSG